MKKAISVSVSCLLAFALLIGLVLYFVTNATQAGASVVKTTEIDDNFDSETIGSNWTAGEGVEQVEKGSVLRFNSTNIWNNAVNLRSHQLTGPCTITFNVTFVQGSAWLGLIFGIPAEGGEMRFADSMIILQDTVTFEYHNEGVEVSDSTDQYDGLANGMGIAVSGGTVAMKVEIVADETVAGTYKAILSYKDAADTEDDYTLCTQEFTGIKELGYFGFASMGGDPFIMDISEFKITDSTGENTLFEDDFSTGSISYPSAINDTANWLVTGQFDSSKVFCGMLKTIGFDGADDAVLLNSVSLSSIPESERAFTVTYEMFLTSLAENGMTGIGFGLSAATDSLDKTVFVGLQKTADGYRLVKSVAGTVTAGAAIEAASVELGSMVSTTVTVEGYCDGSVSVSVAGVSSTFEDVAFEGAFGLGVINAGVSSALEIDNFVLETYAFQSSDAEDMAINFQGTRSWEEFGDTYHELYLDETVWLRSGSGVSLGDYGDNCLNFINAIGNVLFGPRRQQYSDVIIRFDVRATATGTALEDYCGIGITVGRDYALAGYQEGTYMVLGSYGGTTWVRGSGMTDTQSTGMNIFADSTTWYNVMFIVSDNSISLYYKAADDPISELGICRGRIEGVNTYGYAAITCTTADNKANNFSITNVSFTNLEV